MPALEAMDEDRIEGEELSWHERLRRWAMRHPKDLVALLAVCFGSGAIAINALAMQTGPHPAPLFVLRSSPPAVTAIPHQAGKTSSSPSGPTATAPTVLPARAQRRDGQVPPVPQPRPRDDSIADPITPSPRIAAAQRALTEFGYGQIKPNGIAGPDTAAAIERFERARKLPLTGQFSERLIRELAIVTGRPIE